MPISVRAVPAPGSVPRATRAFRRLVVDALAMLATGICLAGEVTELPTPWVSGRSITSASSCVVRWW